MVRVIIIDDEVKICENLEQMLADSCPNVEVVAACQSVDSGISAIRQFKPDAVFLDVQLKGETGFDLLSKMPNIDFEVIFSTGHAEHAVRAFQFSAIDYLLKPIDAVDLKRAVEKVDKKRNSDITKRIETLISNFKPAKSSQYKMAIPSSDGLVFVKISDIIYCEASGNYTTFYTADGKKYLVCRTLKEYDDMLSDSDFFRVHNSYLINLNSVKKYIRGDGGQVIMSNDISIDVSKRKKESFMQRIGR
jgi:two-component system, LytTR family, response regulator